MKFLLGFLGFRWAKTIPDKKLHRSLGVELEGFGA